MAQAASSPAGNAQTGAMKEKSVGTAYLLWVLFGFIGGHRLYLERVSSGLIQMMLMILGLVVAAGNREGWILVGAILLWVVVDAFLIPRMVRAQNASLASHAGPAIA